MNLHSTCPFFSLSIYTRDLPFFSFKSCSCDLMIRVNTSPFSGFFKPADGCHLPVCRLLRNRSLAGGRVFLCVSVQYFSLLKDHFSPKLERQRGERRRDFFLLLLLSSDSPASSRYVVPSYLWLSVQPTGYRYLTDIVFCAVLSIEIRSLLLHTQKPV